jgi:hypothetical protein
MKERAPWIQGGTALLFGSQPGGRVWKDASISGFGQRFLQRQAQHGKLLGSHQLLHALEEFALFFADVRREFLYQRL